MLFSWEGIPLVFPKIRSLRCRLVTPPSDLLVYRSPIYSSLLPAPPLIQGDSKGRHSFQAFSLLLLPLLARLTQSFLIPTSILFAVSPCCLSPLLLILPREKSMGGTGFFLSVAFFRSLIHPPSEGFRLSLYNDRNFPDSRLSCAQTSESPFLFSSSLRTTRDS